MEAIAHGVSCATVFGHKGKSAAMDHIWANRTQLFADYLAAPDKIQYFRSIPWIGDITCYHLAKHFGAQVAKPDVHLVRVADRHATNSHDLCEIGRGSCRQRHLQYVSLRGVPGPLT